MYPSSITPDCGRPWKKYQTHSWHMRENCEIQLMEEWSLGNASQSISTPATEAAGAPPTHFICGEVGCENRLMLIKLDHNSSCLTGEELRCGNAELDFFVYLVGQVRALHSCPAGAETSLQGHPLHIFRNLQQLQNIHVTGWKWENKKRCYVSTRWNERAHEGVKADSDGGNMLLMMSGWRDFVVWLI